MLLILFLVPATQAAQTTNLTTNPAPHKPSPLATNDLSFPIARPGFRVELVAASPLVAAPVAMAFDENGRLFVAEMRDYPNGRNLSPHLGRIRLLEDPDGEGVFTTSSVYADNLPWPSAVACYDHGLFVAAAPDLFYLKDTKGKGLADVRRIVLSGFGGSIPDARALPNSLNWGLDNRIHGASGGGSGVVGSPIGAGSGPVSLVESDFAFDPKTLTVFPESGPTQSGLSFDSRGRRFTTDFARPLRLPVFEEYYAARNTYFPSPPQIIDVASPATPVFRLIPSALPAPPRSASAPSSAPPLARLPAAISSIWLTNSTGTLIYRGSALPTNFFDNAFIPDPEAHVVHRAIIRENGLEPFAIRAPEEKNTEFLLSADPLFQPAQVINGPDGALYVADFHGGGDNGRIFRVVPQAFNQPKPPHLGRATTLDLIAALAQLDGWHSDTAARLLYERQDPAAIPLLGQMFRTSRLPLVRLHALHALDGAGALTEPLLLHALADSDSRLREHAVLLSEKLLTNGIVSDTLWDRFKNLAADPSLYVRYQLALTAGEIRRPDKADLLALLLQSDLTNSWMRAAVLSSVAEDAAGLFSRLVSDPRFNSAPAGFEFLRQLATMIGTRGRLEDVTRTLDFLSRSIVPERPLAFSLIYNLGDGLERTRSSLALLDPQNVLQPFYTRALSDAPDNTFGPAIQVPALQLLSVSPSTLDDYGDWLLLLFGTGQSPAVQSAALQTLTHYADPRVATNLFVRWQFLTPPLRTEALSDLLARPDRIPIVLSAFELGWIPTNDLSESDMNFLRNYPLDEISQRALKLFGPTALERPDVMRQFQPALRLAGAPDHGHTLFLARCAACHRFANEGTRFGPDLTAARISGKQMLVNACLQPNTAINPDFPTSVLVTRDGRNLIGILTDTNLLTVTFQQLGQNREIWPRLNIETIRTEPWSLMPNGLEQGLSSQDLADLLAFLMSGGS